MAAGLLIPRLAMSEPKNDTPVATRQPSIPCTVKPITTPMPARVEKKVNPAMIKASNREAL